MLLLIAGILAVLWLLGLLGHIGGGLIHILLIVALIVFIYHFIGRRKTHL
ncbi:MAG TPA: lmo0937 family membrane protein [Candidatus Dormibacteraeota bacterium]|nr:lmo0937 family membrane protein [Candidatus Dormibacteraeota bacterium]